MEIIKRLENKFDSRFDELENKFESRFDKLEKMFESRFDELEKKLESMFDKLENKVDKLENNRCFSFPNFCFWSRYVLPLNVFRLS